MSQTPEFAPAHVSVVNEFPEDLYNAMRGFVRSHPHWDQYRLMQVALAGFLFQQGSRERAVARHYLDGLFDRGGAPPEPAAATRPPEGAAEEPRRQPGPAGPEAARPLRRQAAPPAAAAPALRPVPQPLSPRPPAPRVSRLAS